MDLLACQKMTNIEHSRASNEKSYMLTGSSGSGKTTIARIIAKQKGINHKPVITTRPRRRGDPENGYEFLEVDEFLQIIKNGLILEDISLTYYNGNYYGTPAKLIDELSQGPCVVCPITVEAAKIIKTQVPNVIWVHLYAETKIVKSRLKKRGCNLKEIQDRLSGGTNWGSCKLADLNIDTGKNDISQTISLIFKFANDI